MTLTNPDGLPPTPNPEGQTKLDRLTPPQPEGLEAQKLLKDGTEQLQKSSKNSDASGGIAAMAMIVAALFVWRQERAESRKKRFEAAPDSGGFDARTEGNLETTLKTREDRIAEIDVEFKANVDAEAALKPSADPTLPSGPIQQKLKVDNQLQINELQKTRADLTKERAQKLVQISMIKVEMSRRLGLVQGLQKGLGPTSVASSATLESGHILRISLRNPLSKNDRDELEKTLTGLRAGSGTTSLDGTSITIALPPEFFAPRFPVTPGSIGASGLSARQSIFAWLAGQDVGEVEQKEKTDDQYKKLDEKVKKDQEGKKKETEDPVAKAEKQKQAEKLAQEQKEAKEKSELTRRQVAFTQTIENRHAEGLTGPGGTDVYRVIEISNGQRIPMYFKFTINAENPRGVVQWTTNASTPFQNIGQGTPPPEFATIMKEMAAVQALSGNALDKHLESESLNAERMQRGKALLEGLGAIMLRNSRNEIVFRCTFTTSSWGAPSKAFYRFDTASNQWRYCEQIDERPGKALNDPAIFRTNHIYSNGQIQTDTNGNFLTEHRNEFGGINALLLHYNGDRPSMEKHAQADAMNEIRKVTGEAQLRSIGATQMLPNRPDLFKLIRGSTTVYFRYLSTNNLGWVWSTDQNAYIPDNVSVLTGPRQGSYWMRLTRTYSINANTTDADGRKALNEAATALSGINTGDLASLSTPTFNTLRDRDNRVQGAIAFLKNLRGGVLDTQANDPIYEIRRGTQTMYVFITTDGTIKWTQDRLVAGARTGGNGLTGPGSRLDGSSTAITELNQILIQLHGLETGSAENAVQFREQHENIQRFDAYREQQNFASSRTFLYVLFRRGMRFEIPHAEYAIPEGPHISSTIHQQQSEGFTGLVGLVNSQTAAQLALGLLEDPASGALPGFYVDAGGRLLQYGDNRVLWPAAGAPGNWSDLLRTDTGSAMAVLRSIPLTSVTNANCRTTLEMIRKEFAGLPISVSLPSPRPPLLEQARQRDLALRQAVSFLYITTARMLNDRLNGNNQRSELIWSGRSSHPAFAVVSVLSGWHHEEMRQLGEASDYRARCIRGYWLLQHNFPRNSTPEEQMTFLIYLNSFTNDQAALAAANKRTQAVIETLNNMETGLNVADDILSTAAGFVPWGAEVYAVSKTAGNLLGGADVKKTLVNNTTDYAVGKAIDKAGGKLFKWAGGSTRNVGGFMGNGRIAEMITKPGFQKTVGAGLGYAGTGNTNPYSLSNWTQDNIVNPGLEKIGL